MCIYFILDWIFAGFLRDKTMEDNFMWIQMLIKLMIEIFGVQVLIKVPKVFKLMNKITCL